MRIVSKSEMSTIKSQASENCFFTGSLLIENTGVQSARIFTEIFKDGNRKTANEVIFLIGKGHNGAQGASMARHLSNLGVKCRAFVFDAESDCKAELIDQLKMAQAFGVAVNFLDAADQFSSYFEQVGTGIVVVDALYGISVQLPLSNFMYDVIAHVNEKASFIISIDIPSGVEGDTGFIQGNAIQADITLAIGFPKLGHYLSDGAKHAGDIYVLEVGLPSEEKTLGDKFLLAPENLVGMTMDRDQFADKKVYGHSLILGGSHGLTGAPALAAKASLKVGSGLVTAATWEPQYNEMIMRLIPEVRTGYIPLDTTKWDRIIRDLNQYSSVVIGPGLARSTRSRRLVLEVLNNFDGPVVIDADGINVLNLKEDAKVFAMRNAPTVLTPDFFEFSKFAGVEYDDLIKSPLTHLKNLVDTINCTVVLKGPCTYLGFSDGVTSFNSFPNDGMATSGVGDVLAGILGGLLGQNLRARDSDHLSTKYEALNQTVAMAVYLHSLAGKIAAEEFGVRPMSAISVIQSLPGAFSGLEKQTAGIFQKMDL